MYLEHRSPPRGHIAPTLQKKSCAQSAHKTALKFPCATAFIRLTNKVDFVLFGYRNFGVSQTTSPFCPLFLNA